MSDVGFCLKRGAETLEAAGIENPWREARLLLSHASGLTEAELIGYPERAVESAGEFVALLDRRIAHEPMSHILGRREFWSLTFEVTADTLDPRPDSETVIEAALDHVRDLEAPLRILDLGTGTGCLLAAMLTELPKGWGIGVERAAATALVAQGNLRRLGLASRGRVVVADWTAPLRGEFDLIVTNPPYIPAADIASLQPEIAIFEPELALDGGADGLSAYREIFPAALKLLAPGGFLIAEFGDGQSQEVIRLAEAEGLTNCGIRTDLSGRPRCLVCAPR